MRTREFLWKNYVSVSAKSPNANESHSAGLQCGAGDGRLVGLVGADRPMIRATGGVTRQWPCVGKPFHKLFGKINEMERQQYV